MNILSRIIEKLKGFIGAVEHKVEEVAEHFEQRRSESLAAHLDALARDRPFKNWRHSIVDLAGLIGEDNSPEGRAALWSELGLEGEYQRTAAQNSRLHAALLEALPSYGIPWPNDDG